MITSIFMEKKALKEMSNPLYYSKYNNIEAFLYKINSYVRLVYKIEKEEKDFHYVLNIFGNIIRLSIDELLDDDDYEEIQDCYIIKMSNTILVCPLIEEAKFFIKKLIADNRNVFMPSVLSILELKNKKTDVLFSVTDKLSFSLKFSVTQELLILKSTNSIEMLRVLKQDFENELNNNKDQKVLKKIFNEIKHYFDTEDKALDYILKLYEH